MSKGTVVIEPIDKHVWGDFKVSGAIRGKDKKPIYPEDEIEGSKKARPRTVSFPGTGIMLNLDNPEHEKLYRVATEDKGAMPFFTPQPNGTRGVRQRFRIKNIQADAEAYLSSRESKVKLDMFIDNISKDEVSLKRFGLIVGLKGDKSIIKAGLYKMADEPKSRAKLAELSQNPDLKLIELIHSALAEGSKDAKTGMWKDGRNLYYWCGNPMALGLEGTMAYLKDSKNADLYQAIKDSFNPKKTEK